MSGMTADDARLILPLVKRIREETKGAKRWDDNGIWAELANCKGHNLALTLERFFRHAADPEAESPGAVRRPFLPAATKSEAPQPPKRDEACLTCGRHLDRCICGEQRTRPVAVDPEVAARGAARARELLHPPITETPEYAEVASRAAHPTHTDTESESA